jgi:mannosyltransferase OCH1-like enzyme
MGGIRMQSEVIPRVIHYCWYGGRPMSELGESCMATWRAHMPDYAVERWDESRLDRSIPYVDIAYRERRFAFVADYVRLQALYAQGGLYFDTDIEVIRPFDALLGQSLFMGLQAPGSVAAGVIGASKGHPFLRKVLDRLDQQGRRGALTYEPLPDLITAVARADRKSALTLYPEEYFYPYNPYSPTPLRQKPLQSNISERTYCLHHWEGSWLGDVSLKMILSNKLRRMWRGVQASPRRPFAAEAGSVRP